jgi:hypothetical protein
MVTAEMLVVVLGASLITLGFATFDWYSHA